MLVYIPKCLGSHLREYCAFDFSTKERIALVTLPSNPKQQSLERNASHLGEERGNFTVCQAQSQASYVKPQYYVKSCVLCPQISTHWTHISGRVTNHPPKSSCSRVERESPATEKLFVIGAQIKTLKCKEIIP